MYAVQVPLVWWFTCLGAARLPLQGSGQNRWLGRLGVRKEPVRFTFGATKQSGHDTPTTALILGQKFPPRTIGVTATYKF